MGTVILSLLASLSVAVAAQSVDEQEGPNATYVTEVAVSEREDADYSGWVMEWSDPRLPSQAEYRYSAGKGRSTHPEGTVMAAQMVGVVRLEGPDGSWSGTDTVLAWTLEPEPGRKSEDTRTELLVLDGEGGYEGLSATFAHTGSGDVPGSYEGFIFEGELPSMPEPIEPAGE